LQIISTFFTESEVTFEGQFYQVNQLPAEPHARPPILIGANGPRMLRLAAKYADIVNFPDRPPVGVSTAGNPGLGITFPEQMTVLREAAGPRFEALELSVLCIPRVTTQVEETIDSLAAQMRTPPQIVSDMPSALIGSVDTIVDKLQRNREQFGLSYAVIPSSALDDFSPVVRRLAR
jgi:alkanesulfonate monooxygenase SsuD/methylene tetrahydromethanopterin reductase-like flavin-dependent oxidoreductase (luciferase family)